jgi:medium-chain acyl-[acyl-carrier-protein] hydrolase
MYSSVYSTWAKIKYNQVNPVGRMRNISLIQLLEEAAIEHCAAIGKDVFTLQNEGFGWVLLAGSLQIGSYPRYNEKVKTDTWISKWSSYRGIREFRMTGEEGQLFAKGTTQWTYADLRKKRPSPVAQEFLERWPVRDERVSTRPFLKRSLDLPSSSQKEVFTARRHDIDSNNHVHNGRYLQWVIETIPEDYYEGKLLTFLEGKFMHSARLNNLIEVHAGYKKKNELIHNVIRQSDGAILATGRSQWRER